jgi:hypothetical protein
MTRIASIGSRLASVLFATLLLSGSLSAQKLAAAHFERGEELYYEAEFSKSLLKSIDVADFRLTATRIPTTTTTNNTADESPLYSLQFTGDVKSKGFFSKLFNLNFVERVISTVEPRSFVVQNTKRFDQQGKRVRSSETVYDHDGGKVIWTELDPRDPAKQPRVASSPFTGQVQDVLSAIYFLRTQPLAVGKSFELTISDSGKVYQVPIRVVEGKRTKTVVGRANTVILDVGLFGDNGLISNEGQFLIWLTADEQHIPVKARVKTEYGTFDIKLKKVIQSAARAST